MRSFEEYNPAAAAVCMLCSTGIAMFCANPVMLILSLCGAAAIRIVRKDRESIGMILFYGGLVLLMPLFNLIFSHNGATVLLVVNDVPLTLEALLYGVNTAVMLLAVLLWFRTFSAIMTADRLQYIFGRLSPGLALLLSMTLRFVPLFGRQAGRINDAQRAMGLYREDNVVDGARSGLRVFSILTTWALENGIITADSMRARGYGTGKRSFFAVYRFRRADGVLMAVSLGLTAVCAAGMLSGAVKFDYYPTVSALPCSAFAVVVYTACGVLAFIPSIIETEARLRWHSLTSEI